MRRWYDGRLCGAGRTENRRALFAPFPGRGGGGWPPPLAKTGTERGRSHHAQRSVRATLVVVKAPVLDQDAGFLQTGEQLDRHELVANPAAEALDTGGCCHGDPGSM